ncbi:MAG TPA: M28 family peptidase [Planctomycetota bacterium]|nr:M28 family peptidase [Planctomycetota bacterium]
MEPAQFPGAMQRAAFAQLSLLALWSCATQPRIPKEFLAPRPERSVVESGRVGPDVIAADSGPARFAKPLYEHFDVERAMATVRFVDGFYRSPGNDGFEASLDHVDAALRKAGFGTREELLIEVISTPLGSAAWTPISARLELKSQGKSRVLHAFDTPSGADRTMLPVGAPSGSAEGRPVFAQNEVEQGTILVVDDASKGDPKSAAERGASALLIASLEDYNVDPSGKDRHLDAIQYRGVRRGASIPVLQISRRSLEAIRAAAKADPKTAVHVDAEVRNDERPLRTLVATVLGSDRPEECVVAVAHVQEPGAVDNASGVGGICEVACTLASLLDPSGAPKIERPSRSVVFLFGDEMRESRIWLDANKRKTIAAVSADMIGASLAATGAVPLLERGPDPGAVKPLPPDKHTAWGQAHVEYAELRPNGVNVVLRTALADVGLLAKGWATSENPYEGGSDHDIFLRAEIPAALLWHFTDFAYHTSLDRIDHVDPQELRRMSCAVAAATLALADPRPADLDRYLRTNLAEKNLRVSAAKDAKDEELARQWEAWSEAVRQWFRRECLRLAPNPEPEKKD